MSDTGSLIRAAIRRDKEVATKLDEQARRAPERRVAGRYTLDEAAKEIRNGAGEEAARGIVLALDRAVKGNRLSAYRPGELVPWQPGALTSWLECYGDDLNA